MGARRALSQVGLDDEQAVHDIRSLRDILGALRGSAREAGKTVVRMITRAIVLLIIIGLLAWVKAQGWLGY